ncbi:MAG: HDOD domain-containing protein [Thermodesulfobacteriota bacterium]|nr:HDOD domain-containing protein [Thermodesulfobacteriota bacterium]
MKIKCDNCSKSYKIPDEKIPKAKKQVTLPCPSCKHIIEVNLTEPAATTGSSATPPGKTGKMKIMVEAGSDTDHLVGDALRAKILKKKSYLPPMPQVVYKARKILADPNSSFNEIGEILEADQAIAARVLRMANSAYYGMKGQVSSIRQASVLLGVQTLGELITVAGSSELLGNRLKGYDYSSGLLWKHSLAVAYVSEMIAEKRNPEKKEDAFLAGLIHDAGKLMLDPFILERRDVINDFLENREKSFLAAEQQILELDHSEIGYELCQQWNIPNAQAVAIRYHHAPAETDGNQLAYILHMADWLAMLGGFGADFPGMLESMDNTAMDVLGLTRDDTDAISGKMVEFVSSVSSDMDDD